jgi:hypothetical protein
LIPGADASQSRSDGHKPFDYAESEPVTVEPDIKPAPVGSLKPFRITYFFVQSFLDQLRSGGRQRRISMQK